METAGRGRRERVCHLDRHHRQRHIWLHTFRTWQIKGFRATKLAWPHVTLELIFTALSEEATRIHAEDDDAQGFNENHDAAQKGGETTGAARQLFEQRTGRKVVSSENFLPLKKGGGEGELPKADDDTGET